MKSFGAHQFARSECPTPKGKEMDQRLSAQQQKFFSRKSSGAQGHAQNIQVQGLAGQGAHHHVQAQMVLNHAAQLGR